MKKPDWFINIFGLRDIGQWKLKWWGKQWILNHQEVQEAINRIQVNKESNKKKWTLIGGTWTIAGAVMLAEGIAFPPLGIATALLTAVGAADISSFEIFISRIKATDKGNGVIIDFYLQYLGSSKGSDNTCSIYPR